MPTIDYKIGLFQNFNRLIFRVTEAHILELNDTFENLWFYGIRFRLNQGNSINDLEDPGSSLFPFSNLLKARSELI